MLPKLERNVPTPGKEITKQMEHAPVKGIELDLVKR